MVVVFPEPLGPRKPKTEPLRHGQINAVDGQLVAEALAQTVVSMVSSVAGSAASAAVTGRRRSPGFTARGGGLQPLRRHRTGEDTPVVE